jgi:hypothetical protein
MRVFTVPSSKDPEAVYHVRLYTGEETDFTENVWTCNCLHWYYNGNTPDYQDCTHVKYARQCFQGGCSGGSGTNPFPLSLPARHASAAQS